MQQLACPNCLTQIPSEKINIEQMLAVCPTCHTVFDFSHMTDEKQEKKRKALEMRKMRAPQGFHVNTSMDGIVMSWRWFNWSAVFMTFFSIAWFGFLIFWYNMAFSMPADGFPRLLFLLFPLIHVGVGVSTAYQTLSLYLNQTVVRVNSDRIQVKTFPLPHPWKDSMIAASDVEQVYVRQKISRGNKSTTVTYDVRAYLYGEGEEILVKGLTNPDFALYIEQELENYLGIEDRPVHGEYGKASI